MKTTPRNEELNASLERAVKSLNDGFVRQCVERHKQEQARQKQRNIETSHTNTEHTATSVKK